jgi:hypothetical protein
MPSLSPPSLSTLELRRTLIDLTPLILSKVRKGLTGTPSISSDVDVALCCSPKDSPSSLGDPRINRLFDSLGTPTLSELDTIGHPSSPYHNIFGAVPPGGLPATITRNTHTTVKLRVYVATRASNDAARAVYNSLHDAFPSITNVEKPVSITHNGLTLLIGTMPLAPCSSPVDPAYSPPFMAPFPVSNAPMDPSPADSSKFLYRNIPRVLDYITDALKVGWEHCNTLPPPPPTGSYFLDPARGSTSSYVIVATSKEVLDPILCLLATFNSIVSKNLNMPTPPPEPPDPADPESSTGLRLPILFREEQSKWLSTLDIATLNTVSTNPALPDGMFLSRKRYELYANQLLHPFMDPLASLDPSRQFLSPIVDILGMKLPSDVIVSHLINSTAPCKGVSAVTSSVDYHTGEDGPLVLFEDPRHKETLNPLLQRLASIAPEDPLFGIFAQENHRASSKKGKYGNKLNLNENLTKVNDLNSRIWNPDFASEQETNLHLVLQRVSAPPSAKRYDDSVFYKKYLDYSVKRSATSLTHEKKVSTPRRRPKPREHSPKHAKTVAAAAKDNAPASPDSAGDPHATPKRPRESPPSSTADGTPISRPAAAGRGGGRNASIGTPQPPPTIQREPTETSDSDASGWNSVPPQTTLKDFMVGAKNQTKPSTTGISLGDNSFGLLADNEEAAPDDETSPVSPHQNPLVKRGRLEQEVTVVPDGKSKAEANVEGRGKDKGEGIEGSTATSLADEAISDNSEENK